MNLLDKQQIMSDLGAMVDRYNLHLFTSIDSTNQYLKDLPPTSNIEICCAETQTNGRGRFGRHWHSPFAENIYFSSRWPVASPLSELGGLSLIASLVVHTVLSLSTQNDEIFIKWPNDLIWRGKKLCGILVEPIHLDQTHVIIGIGLNVNSATEKQAIQAQLERPWCSLFEITGHAFNRNHLIAQLVIQLYEAIQTFSTLGFSHFIPDWHRWDYLYGKQINVSQPTKTLRGIAKGVNALGHLRLLDEHGVEHSLNSGETSLLL